MDRADFDRLLAQEELPLIELRREQATPISPPLPARDSFVGANNLAGLALSGGGIRSAAFNLGLIQALVKRGIFRLFDYLSCVSGGGYTGSMLAARASAGRSGVTTSTFPQVAFSTTFDSALVDRLRAGPNYLSPNSRGRFADVLFAFGFAARGFVVHVMLGLVVFGALVLPNLVWDTWFLVLCRWLAQKGVAMVSLATFVALLLLFHALESVWDGLSRLRRAIHIVSALTLLFSPALWLLSAFRDEFLKVMMSATLGVPLAGTWIGQVAAFYAALGPSSGAKTVGKLRQGFRYLFGVGALVAVSAFFFRIFIVWVPEFIERSKLTPDETRAILRNGAAWILLLSLVLFAVHMTLNWLRSLRALKAPMLDRAETVHARIFEGQIRPDTGVRAILMGASCLFAILFAWAYFGNDPQVFLRSVGVALGIAVSCLCSWVAVRNVRREFKVAVPAALAASGAVYLLYLFQSWTDTERYDPNLHVYIFILALGISFCLFMNLNRTSLHTFYRERLRDTFLRSPPHPGESKKDHEACEAAQEDLSKLREKVASGFPYPLFHCTVNLPAEESDEDSSAARITAERKGQGFLFSPCWVGSESTGLVAPGAYAAGGQPLLLRTSMAISGAAVNSHHAGKLPRFLSMLMTLFNARLGYWLPNPHHLARRVPHRFVRPSDEESCRAALAAYEKGLERRREGDVESAYRIFLWICQRVPESWIDTVFRFEGEHGTWTESHPFLPGFFQAETLIDCMRRADAKEAGSWTRLYPEEAFQKAWERLQHSAHHGVPGSGKLLRTLSPIVGRKPDWRESFGGLLRGLERQMDRLAFEKPIWPLYFLREMFSTFGSKNYRVLLSDGGHFDNLGLYELVRRRCRYILVGDAVADPRHQFDDLANAIRRCRVDHGCEIDLDLSLLKPDPETGLCRRHVAVGEIKYSDGFRGILVYVKSSLTGDEPADLLQHRERQKEFPHESTVNQFFDEVQFESYRRLGQHVGDEVFQDAPPRSSEQFFGDVRDDWRTPAPDGGAAFVSLCKDFMEAEAEDAVQEPNRLDVQQYPELARLLPKPKASGNEYPLLHHVIRQIQVMENFWMTLKLEESKNRMHPDNRGAMNLFRRWAKSEFFREVYKVVRSIYGKEFQAFCEEHLGLPDNEACVGFSDPIALPNDGLCRVLERMLRYEVRGNSLVEGIRSMKGHVWLANLWIAGDEIPAALGVVTNEKNGFAELYGFMVDSRSYFVGILPMLQKHLAGSNPTVEFVIMPPQGPEDWNRIAWDEVLRFRQSMGFIPGDAKDEKSLRGEYVRGIAGLPPRREPIPKKGLPYLYLPRRKETIRAKLFSPEIRAIAGAAIPEKHDLPGGGVKER